MSISHSTSLLEDADGFVREYLLWRGFHMTLQSFAIDTKDDSLSGLSSRKLVQKLSNDIDMLKLDNIFAWWDEGVGPLLSRVDEQVATVGKSLRDSTYRLFLVVCFKQQRIDLILNFFREHWTSRIGSSRFREEWRRQWFALPYTPMPERDRYFSVFFSSEWRQTLISSLEGFLNSLFLAMPPPRLIALSSVSDTVDSMRAELELLRNTSGHLKNNLTRINEDDPNKQVATPTVPIRMDMEEENTFKTTFAHKEESILAKRHGVINRVRFSPSCTLAASCGSDATALVMSPANTQARTPRLLCDSTASCLDWYNDAILAVGTLDHSIHVWSHGGGASKVSTLRTSASLPWVLDLAFDPSTSSASSLAVCAAPALASLPGELQIWNLQLEKLDRVLRVEPAPARFNTVRLNHNGSLLVAGSSDGMIRVFDTSRSGAIMGWPAFQGSSVGALCLSRSETSVYAVDAEGRNISEWSLHRVGDPIRRWTIDQVAPGQQPNRCHNVDIVTSGSRLGVASHGFGTIIKISEDEPVKDRLTIPGASTMDWDEDKLVCGRVDGTVQLLRL